MQKYQNLHVFAKFQGGATQKLQVDKIWNFTAFLILNSTKDMLSLKKNWDGEVKFIGSLGMECPNKKCTIIPEPASWSRIQKSLSLSMSEEIKSHSTGGIWCATVPPLFSSGKKKTWTPSISWPFPENKNND